MRKRITSLLLTLIMVLSLLPAIEQHARADYNDGADCDDCGHYHWDEYRCDTCGRCSAECTNDDCYADNHCPECGKCRTEGVFKCDCGMCMTCAVEVAPDEHCAVCAEEKDDLCSDCGCCEDCREYVEKLHCEVCGDCAEGGAVICTKDHPAGKDTEHCVDETEAVCTMCGGCFFEHTDEYCWDCKSCQSCIDSYEKHCFECNACPSDEWPCNEATSEVGFIVCESCCVDFGHHCSDCYKHVNFDDYPGVEGWCADGGHGTHCDECAELTRCLQCEHCFDCAGLDQCDDCYLCEECCLENSEDAGCTHGYCVESADYLDHLCPDCDSCSGDDPCEFCGRCSDDAAAFHCEHDRCEEDPDYEYEHICPDCSDCFWADQLCETCELCEDCALTAEEHCQHNICKQDIGEWSGHACPGCGECPGEEELCPTCGLCGNCTDHCEHGACKYADDFGSCGCVPCPHASKSEYQHNLWGHWKLCPEEGCGIQVDRGSHEEGTPVKNATQSTEDTDVYDIPCEFCGYVMAQYKVPKGQVPPHVHKYDANGYCTVCGSKSDGKPYIIRQPENHACTIPMEDNLGTMKANFSLRAYGTGELKYQWYAVGEGGHGYPLEDSELYASGTKTPNLTVIIPEDACKTEYAYYCVISNVKGSVQSQTVKIDAAHRYSKYLSIDKLDTDGNVVQVKLEWNNGATTYYPVSDVHALFCTACGERKPGSQEEKHTYSPWTVKQEPGGGYRGIKCRTCKVCGHYDYAIFTAHTCSYVVKYDESGHWEECSICGKKKPLADVDMDWGNPVYKAPHRYGSFRLTTPPTEDAVGEETAYCVKEGCSATLTREIKKLPHEHDYFTIEDYVDLIIADGRWEVEKDSQGNVIGGTYYVDMGAAELKILSANQSHHWLYCKKPGCNAPGKLVPHNMKHGWIVDLPPNDITPGSAKMECHACAFEVRIGMPAGSYPLLVEHGRSYNASGAEVSSGSIGETITIKAQKLEGKTFQKWVVHSGGVTIADPTSPESTFVVVKIPNVAPGASYADYSVRLQAVYTDCSHRDGTITGEVIPAGCESYGQEGDTLCVTCGEVLREGEKLDPTGHAPEVDWEVDPASVKTGDCTHFGNSGNLLCPDCKQIMKQGERTPRVHGSTKLEGQVAATCSSRGYTGDTICTLCNRLAERGTFTDKDPHTFSAWTLQRPATETLPGKEVRECLECGIKEHRDVGAAEIPVTGVTLVPHTLSLQVGQTGTLTATVAPEDATDRSVTWHSSNESVAKVVNGTVIAMAAGTATITVTTRDGGFEAHCSVDVTKKDPRMLTGISITTAPAKTVYQEGEIFDPTGMVVTATYDDGSTATVTDYTYSPSGALTESDVQVIICYTEDGVTKQAVQPITVKADSPHSGGGTGGSSVTTYAITVKDTENGAVTSSHKSAAKGTTVTLTAAPDKGYVLDKITVLDSKDNAVKLTEKDGKFTFTMPGSKVTVQAAFKAQAPTDHPFTDIPVGSWYEDAVAWAVDKGITAGTSATTFTPSGICTRAQAVTFLWRAAGSPAPKSTAMAFTDVPVGSYYYDAVLWAVEQGIVKGTSATTFSPDLSCSRAQIVTLLYRAAGIPMVSGDAAFTDVAADAYYAEAVKWAEMSGITNGIGGGLFGSDIDCTRAQIVTFIYRYMEK